ncbi:glycosyltransferase, partial [Acidimicrobiaceae bacterium USS-CC1]|nr:glycosyltransferase [Acidiferrimicrobium australe]
MTDEADRVTVGVGIPTCSYERAEDLATCLEGINSGSRRPARIVVSVDSNPLLARHLARRPDVGQQADVVVVDGAGVGVSEARNEAAAAVGTDIVLFIDDDVRPHQRWVEGMVSALVQPGVVAAGGRVLPVYESPRRRLPPELLWLVGCTYAGHADGPGPISRPIGAAMGFWRDRLLEVGGFNARFGPRRGRKASSNEELELAVRLREAYGDEAIRYQPHAIVFHKVPEQRCTWRYLTQRCWVEG